MKINHEGGRDRFFLDIEEIAKGECQPMIEVPEYQNIK
jgi:hypothetical protein